MNPLSYFFKPKIGAELLMVIKAAHERARRYAHDYVGVEHVFLSLQELPDSSPAAAILRQLPIDQRAFWNELEKGAHRITGRPVPAMLPHTPRLQFILERAGRWAKQGKKKEITASHFIAAVCVERSSFVAETYRQVSEKTRSSFSDAQAAAAYFAMLVTNRGAKVFQSAESNQSFNTTTTPIVDENASSHVPCPTLSAPPHQVKKEQAKTKLSHSVSGEIRLFSFWLANRTADLGVIAGIDYSFIFSEPSALEQVYAIFVNVLEIGEDGKVTNAEHARKRAAQYIRKYVEGSKYTVEPPFEDWEVYLH
jgi:Clp amino terminal domain, pathogenicity island component